MDLESIDLNLLFVFEALLKSRSVTQAGKQLGMSQPAMSYALARLRKMFNDPLFVRIRNEMCPTPSASALAAPAMRVLDLVRTDLLRHSGFDPPTTNRTFTFCMTDIGVTAFLPPIIRLLAKQAPHVNLRVVSLLPQRIEEGLEAGTVDLVIGYFPDLQKGRFFQQLLFSSGFVCVARENNPYVMERLTLPRFLKATHVAVRAEGRSSEVIETEFARAGICRRVFLTVPHFLSLLNIIPQTDLVATVPIQVAEALMRESKIRLHPLPLKSPLVPIRQVWHKRYHKDPANQWIRSIVRTALQDKAARS